MIDREKYVIDKETGCWNFKGCKTYTGYGRIRVNGVHWMAHRYSLSCHLGRPIADGMVVMHICDNPSCVNPEHLKEGTQKENMADCKAKGRMYRPGRPKVNTSKAAYRSDWREYQVVRYYVHWKWKPSRIAKKMRLSIAWVKRVLEEHVSH
ncbi:predicted endonuclease [Salmonella phage Vi06]|uniref:Predicted endonuclease n=1 Tax=Salmonella phage Vi06 TaxID=866889 RepID=E1XUC6_9CAUD|nr:HNH endonuclease [Salmonella phage Vi06]CBV65248.1 predicted endonuclease [Salmonella phage Vi06]